MGQSIQVIKAVETMQMDSAEEIIKATESVYKLNVENSINNNPDSMGGNAGVSTPSPGNRYLAVFLPAGLNTTLHAYESEKTNETYVFFHNSLGNHGIYRINGINNSVQMVLTDPGLNFSLEDRHTLHGRVYLFFNNNSFRETDNKIFRKYLLWTDGQEWQGFLDVETSIATNGFRLQYFSTADRKQLWQLAPRPSLHMITGNFMALDPLQRSYANLMKRRIFQYRIKYIYTDGRTSAWGPISTTYLQLTSACQTEAVGQSRCQKLTIDAGGPHVEKILFAFRNCAGNLTADQANEWYQAEVIEKYDKCLDSSTPFYERQVRTDMEYNPFKNTFQYIFCNDKACVPIPRTETDLSFNPVPITSFSLAPLGDRVMLLNNKKGFDPIDCDSLEKFSFNVTEPLNTDCQVKMVVVKFAIIIHNVYRGMNQFIYNMESDTRRDMFRQLFGGLGPMLLFAAYDDPTDYDQYFTEIKDPGFIVYMEGTTFFGVTKQYKVHKDGLIGTVEESLGNMGENSTHRKHARDLTDEDHYYIQAGEMKVPKGTRGFLRVASHKATRQDRYQDTSTTVAGVLRNRANYRSYDRSGPFGLLPGGYFLDSSNTNFLTQEIYVDTCYGAFDARDTPFIVADLTGPDRTEIIGSGGTAITGYLTDKDGRPVEHAEVHEVNFQDHRESNYSFLTDHNGFYWWRNQWQDNAVILRDSGVEFLVEGPGCAKVNGGQAVITRTRRVNETIIKNTVVTVLDYNIKYYAILDVFITDNQGLPIPGVNIAVAGRKARQTDSTGHARIFVRNDQLTYGVGMNLQWVVMQSGLCYLTYGNCEACMPTGFIGFPHCFQNNPVVAITNITPFNALNVSKGLQPGGQYSGALKFIDAAGRETFAEGDYRVTLPAVQEKGKFSFSQVGWTVTGQMNLPAWVKKMGILLGANRTHEMMLEFVADKLEFLDAGGKTATNLSAEKVRISYRALFDYQRSYSATNLRYQFLAGDEVQFIADHEGTILDRPVDNLTFQIEGEENNRELKLEDEKDRYSTLVVTYSKELINLKEGSLFRILRPKVCLADDFFYEVDLVDVVAGEPVVSSGVLSTFDSYYLRRQIRYDERVNTFTFPFLHHSPSDFWGDHCISRGRVSVKNPYEKQIQYGRNAMISDVLLDTGSQNGLGSFSDTLSKDFQGEQRGDIIQTVSKESVLLVIAELDHFISRVGDDFVRVGSDGILQAMGAEAVVSNAQGKIIGDFGCQYDDAATLVTGDGWVFWVDANKAAPVLTNYGQARDVSEGKMKSYFSRKLQHKFQNNQGYTPKIKMVAGRDPVTGNIMLTFFSRYLTGPAINSYVHSRPEVNYSLNETISITASKVYEGTNTLVPVGSFETFQSFTPEAYGTLINSATGKLFITFMLGQPFLHREYGLNTWNVFYGQGCDQVIETVINALPGKVKRFLVMQQQTAIPYYADRIITSRGQVSEIPPIRVQKFSEGKYDAEFLCDKNSKGGLFNGDKLYGMWMKVRLIRDSSQAFKVGTRDIAKQIKYNQLDVLLFKFMLSEQSAYNANQNT